MKLFSRLNPRELLFDFSSAAFVVVSITALHGRKFYEAVPSGMLIPVTIILFFMMPRFLFDSLWRYKLKNRDIIQILLLPLLIFCIYMAIILSICFQESPVFHVYGDNIQIILGLYIYLVLIFSIANAYTHIKPEGADTPVETDTGKPIRIFISVSLGIYLAVFPVIDLDTLPQRIPHIAMFYYFFTLAGFPFIAYFLLNKMSIGWNNLLTRKNLNSGYAKFRLIALNSILPLSFLFINDMIYYVVRNINGAFKDSAVTGNIFFILFSGYLPVRLILLFEPPFIIGNFLIGIISLVFYFWFCFK